VARVPQQSPAHLRGAHRLGFSEGAQVRTEGGRRWDYGGSDRLHGRAHARDARVEVFPRRLASGSPQGPKPRALLGRPGEGIAYLAQARRLRQPHGARGLRQENLNRDGLRTQPPMRPRTCGRQGALRRSVGTYPTGVIKIVESWAE
jgi:hypothetical protein